MHSHSLHEVRADAFNYVWDNSIAPVLEVGSGEEVSFTSATPATSRSGPTRASRPCRHSTSRT